MKYITTKFFTMSTYITKPNGKFKPFIAAAYTTLFLVLLSSVALAQNADKDANEIIELEKKLIAVRESNDKEAEAAFIERFYGDDFYGTNANGVPFNKSSLLAWYRSEEPLINKVVSIDVADQKVQLYSDAAIYTAKTIRRTIDEDGIDSTNQYRIARFYAKKDGEWKLVGQHITMIDPKVAAK